MRFAETFTTLFPLWVVLCGAAALVWPDGFTWFSGPWIVWGLGGIMVGMGLTLTAQDFTRVARVPRPILLGLLGQFTIMPLLGYGIGRLLGLPPAFAVGLILVSACPGGTASNVVAWLARAHVALSVTMTALSTAAAIVLTPWMTAWLAGTVVAVDPWALLGSTVRVVLLPVTVGVLINTFLPRVAERVKPVAPVLSVVLIVLIVASILGTRRDAVLGAAPSLLLAVFLLHAGGFALGWGLAALFGHDDDVRRTVSIEVGMQNSGLGAVLAQRHFADPLTAVPSAMSAAMHSVIGSVLAAWWRRSG